LEQVQHLVVQVGRPGNELPEVVQGCLVLQDDDKKDVGQQEAAVTKQSPLPESISLSVMAIVSKRRG
jgi:hypothetical protein